MVSVPHPLGSARNGTAARGPGYWMSELHWRSALAGAEFSNPDRPLGEVPTPSHIAS
jgi:hypothetical protein